jgi:hypothetical protein
LASLLRRTREPAVVFTEFRDSLLAIAGVLAGARRVALLHGGLTSSEQRRALEAFLNADADVLVATDVASQGLNLQHRARWVVHLDLPWTPMRLEQRIGRVDRIGQARVVHVTEVGVRHQAQAALRRRVATRQDASDNAQLLTCTRWTRAAAGVTHLFARQRSLAGCWRGPAPPAVSRAQVQGSTFCRLCVGVDSKVVTIVELPLVAATGEVIERWFGWVAGDAFRDDVAALPPALLRRAQVLSTRARGRLARLHAAQASDAPRSPSQPGLFDVRITTGPHANGDSAISIETSHNVVVRAGDPRPVLILERRS